MAEKYNLGTVSNSTLLGIYPRGWARQNEISIKGWNANGVLETYKAKWPAFVKAIEGHGPLGLSHESPIMTVHNYAFHNTLISYAYVLALAARNKERISILDWGGGIGHYNLISRAVLPGVEIDYHCKDVSVLCAYGRELFPEAHFYEDATCFDLTYDLVLVSASLQYSQYWALDLQRLVAAARNYLYVTRLPIVFHHPSFVVLQRAYDFGYETEYLGWFLNHAEFLQCVLEAGMVFKREFLIDERPIVYGVPAQGEYRGFLFQSP